MSLLVPSAVNDLQPSLGRASTNSYLAGVRLMVIPQGG